MKAESKLPASGATSENGPRALSPRQAMVLSIQEADASIAENNLPHPKVGVVILRGKKLVGKAHRGEKSPGDHAEFTVLEKKFKKESLAGCTVYTTLEPCTKRNHPKIPCAQRLIDRRVKKVVIGMLDPNPVITGRGELALRSAGIKVERYPTELVRQIEEQNREFIHFQEGLHQAPPDFVERAQKRRLDEWYRSLNQIYWGRNYYADADSIFAHLAEVVGGLSLLASGKVKPGVNPELHVPKAVAWWLALCGKLNVRSVEDMLWDKFPAVCPYCLQPTHDSVDCGRAKATGSGPGWSQLRKIGEGRARPSSLGAWQRMFYEIYKIEQTDSAEKTFARLCEELGELAEAVRVFTSRPTYFLSEACDVFAWLMRVQNQIEAKKGVRRSDLGAALEQQFSSRYPDYCTDCRRPRGNCPPILESTIGRIAHDVPFASAASGVEARFMTPPEASEIFGKSNTALATA